MSDSVSFIKTYTKTKLFWVVEPSGKEIIIDYALNKYAKKHGLEYNTLTIKIRNPHFNFLNGYFVRRISHETRDEDIRKARSDYKKQMQTNHGAQVKHLPTTVREAEAAKESTKKVVIKSEKRLFVITPDNNKLLLPFTADGTEKLAFELGINPLHLSRMADGRVLFRKTALFGYFIREVNDPDATVSSLNKMYSQEARTMKKLQSYVWETKQELDSTIKAIQQTMRRYKAKPNYPFNKKLLSEQVELVERSIGQAMTYLERAKEFKPDLEMDKKILDWSDWMTELKSTVVPETKQIRKV